jgi:hypothetical protein
MIKIKQQFICILLLYSKCNDCRIKFVKFCFDERSLKWGTTALAIALSKIFWRCGENKAAVVVL